MGRVFTRRLVHQVAVRTPDGAGGHTRRWEERGAIWGDVRMRSGGLGQSDFGHSPRLRLRILTHFVPHGHPTRPEPGQRLRDGARIFAVEAVQETEGRAKHLVVLASEIAASEAEG
ncbi:MAG: head-tail adaptor protein [Pseudomonadota bacterium]